MKAFILIILKTKKILIIYDALNEINKEKLIEFIAGLQQEDGSFSGDKWGKILKKRNL